MWNFSWPIMPCSPDDCRYLFMLKGVPSINSSALKYLNISVCPGTISSHDDYTEMGWKHASLRL